jgi:hypothetical protein
MSIGILLVVMAAVGGAADFVGGLAGCGASVCLVALG